MSERSENVIDRVHQSMEDKARADLDYHMDIWRDHIGQLSRLISHRKGGLTYDRYMEIRDELLIAAEAIWGGQNDQ